MASFLLFSAGAAPVSVAAPATPVVLFNGKDLTGWYSYSTSSADRSPHGVFKVEDGAIHILGQDFGYIATEKSYENYTLTVEFKWGEKQFAPRATGKRDSGVLYHSGGRTRQSLAEVPRVPGAGDRLRRHLVCGRHLGQVPQPQRHRVEPAACLPHGKLQRQGPKRVEHHQHPVARGS